MLLLYLGNSQVSVYRTIGPTLVFNNAMAFVNILFFSLTFYILISLLLLTVTLLGVGGVGVGGYIISIAYCLFFHLSHQNICIT